jgi:hypothetical protein
MGLLSTITLLQVLFAATTAVAAATAAGTAAAQQQALHKQCHSILLFAFAACLARCVSNSHSRLLLCQRCLY